MRPSTPAEVPEGSVFFYREGTDADERWLVDRDGRIREFERFRRH